MAKTTPRLFTELRLCAGAELTLPPEHSHYLAHVLRLSPGDGLRLFNGTAGEWLCYITAIGRRELTVRVERKTQDVRPPPDIDYVFAPLKHARLDYLVQKATELGARRLRPVITKRTIAERINLKRMRDNVIEAAEQCNLVFVPDLLEPVPLPKLLASWEVQRCLIHCDEAAPAGDTLSSLAGLQLPAAVIVGPEGGFTPDERELLRQQPFVTAVWLGPRIMRADTVAIAALALLQASVGDWRPSQGS